MKIDHLGIAVRSIEESLKFYVEALGLCCTAREIVEEQGVQVAMVPLGESRVELLEPTSDDTPVGRFLEKRGEGLHHVCIEVEDLAGRLAELKALGARLIDESPRVGAENRRIAFVHPSSAHGVLLELVERSR